jgi:two-component system, OmpR family, response regulator
MNMFLRFFKKINPDKKLVFIVEDNEVYARTLQGYLQNRFSGIIKIKLFRIGELCLEEMHLDPGIVIMDYFLDTQYLEATNGIEIIKRIKAQKPQTNIIVLSAQEDYHVALDAIKEYGCIYVQKDQDAFNKVEQFIREIFNRENTPAFGSLN